MGSAIVKITRDREIEPRTRAEPTPLDKRGFEVRALGLLLFPFQWRALGIWCSPENAFQQSLNCLKLRCDLIPFLHDFLQQKYEHRLISCPLRCFLPSHSSVIR